MMEETFVGFIKTSCSLLTDKVFYFTNTTHDTNKQLYIIVYQGPIIAFNILDIFGRVLGHSLVAKKAAMFSLGKIYFRTGRHCNPGAAQKYLNIPGSVLRDWGDRGYTCGDGVDFIEGKETGACRVSLGACCDEKDVAFFLMFLQVEFMQKDAIPVCISKSSKSKTKSFGSDMGNNVIELDIGQRFIYPIKSCGPVSIPFNWPITFSGYLYDRFFMVVEAATGLPITLKKDNRMRFIHVSLFNQEEKADKNGIIVNAPGMESELRLGFTSTEMEKENSNGSLWFSTFLKRPCKLVRQNRSAESSDTTSSPFMNSSSFLLVTAPSVQALLSNLAPSNTSSISSASSLALCFRPNLVSSSNNLDAFVETDAWTLNTYIRDSQSGTLFRVVEACERCAVVNASQSDKEPLRTLTRMQRVREESRGVGRGKIVFGVYLMLVE